MHDFTEPISPQLAAALHKIWKAPTVANCLRVAREADARTQAQLDSWEGEGGTPTPRIQSEG